MVKVSGRYRWRKDGVILQYLMDDGTVVQELVVPAMIDGRSIYRLGRRAFKGCNIESVVIPAGIRELGKECFTGCKLLRSVTLPDTLIEIEDNVFKGCDKLVEVYLPDTVRELGFGAFSYCRSLQSISIPGTVLLAGKGIFMRSGLKSDRVLRRGIKNEEQVKSAGAVM